MKFRLLLTAFAAAYFAPGILHAHAVHMGIAPDHQSEHSLLGFGIAAIALFLVCVTVKSVAIRLGRLDP